MSAPNYGEITDALIVMLRDVTGLDIWEAVDTEGDTQVPATYPYVIVEQVTDGVAAGADRGVLPDVTQNVIYQLTGVARTRRAADDVNHACKDAILAMDRNPLARTNPIEGPTSRVIDRTQNSGSGTRPAGVLWNSFLRYQFLATRHTT